MHCKEVSFNRYLVNLKYIYFCIHTHTILLLVLFIWRTLINALGDNVLAFFYNAGPILLMYKLVTISMFVFIWEGGLYSFCYFDVFVRFGTEVILVS